MIPIFEQRFFFSFKTKKVNGQWCRPFLAGAKFSSMSEMNCAWRIDGDTAEIYVPAKRPGRSGGKTVLEAPRPPVAAPAVEKVVRHRSGNAYFNDLPEELK